MKIVSRVVFACLFAVGFAGQAGAVVIYNSSSAGTNNTDIDTDITASFGTLTVPPGPAVEVYQIERIRFREPNVSPQFLTDRFRFTVNEPASSEASFQSLILNFAGELRVGMRDITLSILRASDLFVVASGFANGLTEDTNDIALSVFNLDPVPQEYIIQVAATVTGLRSGQYNLALAVLEQLPPIPLPPALLLFGTAIAGLMGFAGFRRKPEELDQA